MSYIAWTDDMACGVAVIDDQHKTLLDLINRVHGAICGRDPHSHLTKIFDDLVDYTMFHFQYEESLFEAGHYPHLADHKRLHTQLKAQVIEHLDQLGRSPDLLLASEVLSFLKDWLVDHIQVNDKQVCAYILAEETAGAVA